MKALDHIVWARDHLSNFGDELALIAARNHLVSALSAANREGQCPKMRASIMRMLNWVRADLRKKQVRHAHA